MSEITTQTEIKPINTDGMRVTTRTDSGNYNWLNSSDVSHLVELRVTTPDEHIHISETWPEDSRPDVHDDTPPSEVLDLIEERLKSYWICTSREDKLAKIARLREVIGKVNIAWAKCRIASLEGQIEDRKRYINSLNGMISDIMEDESND